MNPQIKKTIFTLGLISTMTLMSCGENKTVVQEPFKIKVTASDVSSSDELTQAAEQLISPYHFMLAYKMAATAYEKDPTNKKAEFYYLFLKRFEAFRGILTRIQPGLNYKQKKDLEKFLAQDLPNSPLKDFLTQKGGSKITTADHVQNVMSEYFAASNEFRKFLKRNEQSQIDLNLNPYVFEGAIKEELMDSCKVIENDGAFTYECNVTQISVKKMNSADLIALRQVVAGEVLYGMFYTAYSVNGLEKLAELDSDNNLTNKLTSEWLFSQPGFGKLRKDHSLKLMRELGSDLSVAASWAIKHQDTLCKSRKGYLYKDGICINEPTEAQDLINQLNSALGGVIEVDLKTANGSDKIKTNINVFAWATNPIADLSQIKPQAWNNCDKATLLADNTVGGIFTENNAHLFLLKTTCE